MSEVGKSFGSTRALEGVSFDVRAGEVHVLSGENGAGKSTLIRILSGAITEYEGVLRVRGERVRFESPAHALRDGIATIHQELSLVGSLSIADNFALLGEQRPWSARSKRRDIDRARASLRELGIDVDPERRVESLPLSVQQELEIARALASGARLIVMDEPTSALGEVEAERLFARISELVKRGHGVVYISHRMEEIFRVADRITVLRDGKHVLTVPASELDGARLVSAMVGRSLGETRSGDGTRGGETALELSSPSATFSLRRGEIVGLAGVSGSGTSELLHALYGSAPGLDGAQLRLGGAAFVPKSPADSLARGLALLGNDRRLGLVFDRPIVENVTVSSLARFGRWLTSPAAELRAARTALSRLGVRADRDLTEPVRALSGGNQQKVALARCLLANPSVLLLDEPTRGIDVGAKADVYRLMRELAGRGVAILFVASELEELLALADRVLVLHRGRLVDAIGRAELSRQRIVSSAMGESAA